MENRDQRPIMPLEVHGQQVRGEVRRGVVIVSVPDGDGKTVCAAFTFKDQESHVSTNRSLRQATVTSERSTAAPERSFAMKRFGKRPRLIVAAMLFVGVVAFLYFRAPWIGPLDYQRDDRDEGAHVHMLYSKRLISMAPGHHRTRDQIPEEGLVERDHSRRRLWEQAAKVSNANGSSLFPVRGNIYPDGLYYMQLLVGSPPKPFFLDVDTGSDLTWLQCNAPCSNCATTPHPLYDPKAAELVDCRQPFCSLLQKGSRYGCPGDLGQCDYEIEYGDRSSTMGVLVSDWISLVLTNGSRAQTKAVFGCSYDQQGTLAQSPSKTDGLLGLSSARVALPAQLAAAGLVKNVVAHCLAGGDNGGGYLFFGDELVPSWGMTWTPMIQKPDMENYFVSVSKIQYGVSTMEISNQILEDRDFIFDSGTSYTYFVRQIYSVFMTAVQEGVDGTGLERDKSDTTLPFCWRGKAPFNSVLEASRYFQPVTLNFGTSWFLASRFMIIHPESYLVTTQSGNVCMGILSSSDGGGDDEVNIIGDISLRGHLVVYDNVQHKVGWMPSDCQRPHKGRALTYV